MKRIIGYRILADEYTSGLSSMVNKEVLKGWSPLGKPKYGTFKRQAIVICSNQRLKLPIIELAYYLEKGVYLKNRDISSININNLINTYTQGKCGQLAEALSIYCRISGIDSEFLYIVEGGDPSDTGLVQHIGLVVGDFFYDILNLDGLELTGENKVILSKQYEECPIIVSRYKYFRSYPVYEYSDESISDMVRKFIGEEMGE